MPRYERDYRPISLALTSIAGDRAVRMRHAADVLWRHLRDEGVSWAGFYLISENDAGESEMVLGPSRDKPACTPIGMHGACGQSFLKKRSLVIADIHTLGAGYVACDPRDLAELVIPMFGEGSKPWGVLDLDSFDRDAFGEHDARELKRIMEVAGISWPSPYLEPLYL
ncbi:MAG: hypothetical protein DHS20C14_11020 [Phycisphaeraceae bacterium]|nr:MAG: hypothetical protein DHS20C14_11020 [Phycisphaeraceae bacterium]